MMLLLLQCYRRYGILLPVLKYEAVNAFPCVTVGSDDEQYVTEISHL